MHSYRLTKKAVEDLAAIWEDRCEEHTEEHATEYYQLLLESCGDIAANPNLDTNYRSIAPDLRGVRISHYIIFYRRTSPKQIETLRILPSNADLKHPEGIPS